MLHLISLDLVIVDSAEQIAQHGMRLCHNVPLPDGDSGVSG